MSPLLALLEGRVPDCIRRGILWVLFRITARAFDRPVPSLAGLSPDECLLQYAQFTQGQAAELLRDGSDLATVQERLYRSAHALGRTCNRMYAIGSVREAMALGRALYSLLDIEFQGDEECVVISHCYFSRFYSAGICQVMSAMDRGLVAGLSDGRQLVFSARITEGQTQCQAHFDMQGERQR